MIDRTRAASLLPPGAYFTECRVDYRMLSGAAQAMEQGFEYHLLGIGISISLAPIITGSGRWSMDRAIASRSTG